MRTAHDKHDVCSQQFVVLAAMLLCYSCTGVLQLCMLCYSCTGVLQLCHRQPNHCFWGYYYFFLHARVFFDGFSVVERARAIRIILGFLCIEMYNVGIPVCVLRDAPTAMYIVKQGMKLMAYHGPMCGACSWCTFPWNIRILPSIYTLLRARPAGRTQGSQHYTFLCTENPI